jgi:hypothetical protein
MRYARICRSTNGWTQPSGTNRGRGNAFPAVNGFGFEEWIMATPTMNSGSLQGLRLGFIQGYKRQKPGFIDDVTLYYMDDQGNRISAISISNCRRLSPSEATQGYTYYTASGFVTIMHQQLASLNLNAPPNTWGLDVFNVVFNPEDATLLMPQQNCASGHTYYTHLYR